MNVKVEADSDCAWVATFQSGSSDFRVTPSSGRGGQELKLTVPKANNAGVDETLNVKGPSGSVAKTVKLKQLKQSCVQSLSLDSKTVDSSKDVPLTEEKTFDVSASTNCKWDAALDNKDFKITKADKQFKITPPAQDTAEHSVTLTVTGQDGAFPITLKLKTPKKE